MTENEYYDIIDRAVAEMARPALHRFFAELLSTGATERADYISERAPVSDAEAQELITSLANPSADGDLAICEAWAAQWTGCQIREFAETVGGVDLVDAELKVRAQLADEADDEEAHATRTESWRVQ